MIKNNPAVLVSSINICKKLDSGKMVTIIFNIVSFSSLITDGYDNIADHIKNKIGTSNWEVG